MFRTTVDIGACIKVYTVSVVLASVGHIQSARGACPSTGPITDTLTGRIEGIVVDPSSNNYAQNASVATDFEGKFIIAYESEHIGTANDVFVQRFFADGTCFCMPGDECPTALTQSTSLPSTPATQPEHGADFRKLIDRRVIVGYHG